MQQDMDKIQFDSRTEIWAIMEALEASPKKDDATVKELIDLLDIMAMSW